MTFVRSHGSIWSLTAVSELSQECRDSFIFMRKMAVGEKSYRKVG